MHASSDLPTVSYRLGLLEQELKGIEVLKSTQAIQQEQIRNMSEEIKELKQELKDAKKEIIESQRRELRRVIYVQGSILLIIAGSFIGLLFKVFFHA